LITSHLLLMETGNDFLPRRHRGEPERKDNHLALRNVLNVIFMLLAIVGAAVYYWSDHTTGAIILLVAVVFKIVESALRIKF